MFGVRKRKVGRITSVKVGRWTFSYCRSKPKPSGK